MNPRRRALAALLASAAAGPVLAQPARPRTVGVLTPSPNGATYLAEAMARRGWVEDRDVRYEVRRVARDLGDAATAAAGLVRAAPDVLYASGQPLVTALAHATRSIPIVCGGISDPVGEGVARTLQRPGGNVTGLSFGLPEVAALQVGTLKQLVPGLRHLRFVVIERDRHLGIAPAHEAAARGAGIGVEMSRVRSLAEVEGVLGGLRPGSDAAWIADLPADAPPESVARAALARGVATHVRAADLVRAGFLFSYWIVHADPLARSAAILEKVLRGEQPGAIPFELPERTLLSVNRATAAGLGLRLPPDLLVRATELIG